MHEHIRYGGRGGPWRTPGLTHRDLAQQILDLRDEGVWLEGFGEEPVAAHASRALLAKLYPVATVDVDVRAAYTTSAPALDANDVSGAWSQILGAPI
jgi:hypothetical protein